MISPYLERPLRSLEEVESRRADGRTPVAPSPSSGGGASASTTDEHSSKSLLFER